MASWFAERRSRMPSMRHGPGAKTRAKVAWASSSAPSKGWTGGALQR